MAYDGMRRPVLVYDGDCGFCTSSTRVVARLIRGDYDVVAWQEADLPALDLDRQACERAVQWVEPSGRHEEGARAFGRLLVWAGGWIRLVGWLALVPPTSWVAAALYSLVAANRYRLPGGTPACKLPPEQRPGRR